MSGSLLATDLNALMVAIQNNGPSDGLSSSDSAAFGSAVVAAEARAPSEDPLLVAGDFSLAVLTSTWAVPYNGTGASLVAFENIYNAAAVAEQGIADLLPKLTSGFSTRTADAVVAKAPGVSSGLTSTSFSQWLAAATVLLNTPADVSLTAGANQTTTPSGQIETVFTNGGQVSGNAVTSVFNTGSIGGNGMSLYGGSVINGSDNNTTASITTTSGRALSIGGPALIENYGTIAGSSGGILASSGGGVYNGTETDTTALINGGIYFGSANPEIVANDGTISGGVGNNGGGPLILINGDGNDVHASISGGINVIRFGEVTNFGTINAGVNLNSGGVTNESTGLISGGIVLGGTSVVANYGTVTASTSVETPAINLFETGSVTNGSASDTKALIQGWGGVGIANGGTVTNFGSIIAGGGHAISTAGAQIINSGLLESAGPDAAIQTTGGTIVNTGTIQGGVLATSVSLLNEAAGSMTQGAVTGHIGTIVNNSTIPVGGYPGLDVTSAIDPSSTGVFQLVNNGLFEVAAAVGTSVKIQFLGHNPGSNQPSNTLVIDNAAEWGKNVGTSSYQGPLLQDFTVGDSIILKGIATSATPSYNPANGVLQLLAGGKPATLLFDNATLGGSAFGVKNDGYGDAVVYRSS